MNLGVYFEYKDLESDHRPCEYCGEMIIGKMWAQVTFVNFEPLNLDNPKMYCNACYTQDEPEEE